MKAKQENEAEIALDVKSATRARAEAEHADERFFRKELAREERALEKSRREKLSTFLYGLATFFLTSTGIGGLSPIILNTGKDVNWPFVFLGIIASILSALTANNILTYKINE